MHLSSSVGAADRILADALARAGLIDALALGRARMRVRHQRPRDWVRGPGGILVPDERSYADVDDPEDVLNVKTDVGIVQLHKQGYQSTGILTNGFNYIALSNDTLTETSASTTLSNEITLNGLGRAQGTVTSPTGSGTQTTVDKTFTASGSQSAQKAALFTASSSGVMNHALAFTQRSLISGDTLQVTYTITLS